MTPELRQALAEWLAWAENGAPEGRPYSRHMGLCVNLDGPDNTFFDELTEEFELDGLDSEYPFGLVRYLEDAKKATQHLNPNRLAWVRKKLET